MLTIKVVLNKMNIYILKMFILNFIANFSSLYLV